MQCGLRWTCLKCHKVQNRVFTFRNDQKLNDIMLIERRKKATYVCKYCNKSYRFSTLGHTKFINIQDKGCAELNLKELR